jgi:hypothetical protein
VFEGLDGLGGWGGFFGGHVRGEVMKSGGGTGGEIEPRGQSQRPRRGIVWR